MNKETQRKLMDSALMGQDPEKDHELKTLIEGDPECLRYWMEIKQIVLGLSPSFNHEPQTSLPLDFHENFKNAIKDSKYQKISRFDKERYLKNVTDFLKYPIIQFPRMALCLMACSVVLLTLQFLKPAKLPISNHTPILSQVGHLQLSMGRMALESEVQLNRVLSSPDKRISHNTQATTLRMMDSRNLELLDFR